MRALSLFAVLCAAKVAMVWGRDLPASVWTPLALLGQDALVALVFLLAERVLRWGRWGWVPYGALCGYAALNVAVARVLGSPLTWPMLRAADGALADSTAQYLSVDVLLAPALVLVLAVAVPVLARKARPGAGWPGVLLLLAAAAGLTAQEGLALPASQRSAVVALFTTATPRVGAEPDTADWRRWTEAETRRAMPSGSAAGRNLVLVVLESAAAAALRPYGAAEDPMPNLTALAAEGILCTDAYATYPESIKGLVALQHSVHPAPDTGVEAYAHVPVPSLASVLRDHGYRSALFHPGRFRYLGMESVLAAGGYDETRDAGDLGGRRESSFGVDEESAVAAMLGWIDGLDPGQRFFLSYLPVAGHHPYDSPSGGPFPYDSVWGCYRNALHYADSALGRLIEGLESRGLWDRTLLCVVGDHGQAFGEHDANFGHTFFLYEENVRVPLVIHASGALPPTVLDRVASHVDVAPTLLDLLGIPPVAGHQGRSLLAPSRGMALFFTDYATVWLGLRDGSWKFLHEVESGRDLLFRIDRDPLESTDLAASEPGRVQDYRDHLRRWAGAQRASVGAWR